MTRRAGKARQCVPLAERFPRLALVPLACLPGGFPALAEQSSTPPVNLDSDLAVGDLGDTGVAAQPVTSHPLLIRPHPAHSLGSAL